MVLVCPVECISTYHLRYLESSLSLFMDIKLVMHMHTAPNKNFP